ncbi:hypothetical protein ABVC71_08090 [Prevotella amnii]|uniref:hypothetical protein n=1 Tax=Prevotella amnii TaxID=419005 RepID=UPI00336A1CB0
MARKSSKNKTTSEDFNITGFSNFLFPEGLPNSYKQKDQDIPWRCFIYKIWYNILYTFRNPFKEPKRELNLLEQVEVLITTGRSGNVIDYCERYIYLHRIIENTRARRRLERWVTRLVSTYLLIVFALIVTSYILKWDLPLGVIITILSTTTVNIVALGYILVRGLFHENENEDAKKEVPKNSNINSQNLNTK